MDDAWTTVDRKPSKKKVKEEKADDEGWSQVPGKDRRKKDSTTLGRPERNNDRRGERRGGERGKPPTGGRGGSGQRNTLPRRGRGGEGGSMRGGYRNTPSPVPVALSQTSKPGADRDVEKAVSKPPENVPRKSSWASLVSNKASPEPADTPNIEQPDQSITKSSVVKDAVEPVLTNSDLSTDIPIAEETETVSGNELLDEKLESAPEIQPELASPHSTEILDSIVPTPDVENRPPALVESMNSEFSTQPATVSHTPESCSTDPTSHSYALESSDVQETNLVQPSNNPEGLVLSIDDNTNRDENSAKYDVSSDSNGNCLPLDKNKNSSSKSPVKIDGSSETRQYDRDMLMQLQRHPLSLQKPEKLPELEIVLSNPMRSSSSAPLLGEIPSQYVHTFNRPPPVKRDSRRKESKKIISLSREPVKLHKAENAWMPSNKNQDDQNELDVLSKKVRAILNKLTPQMFSKLVEQFKELTIDTEPKLVQCMELVFEKAVEEPAFSSAYASMCRELSQKKIQEENSSKPVDFRTLLIRRCQKEFLADYISDEQRKKYVEDLGNAKNEEEEKNVRVAFELLEQKLRRRSIGNIRFISELYNLKMLGIHIMTSIIGRLLTAGDEESLECLCRLLTTSGSRMEAEAEAQKSFDFNAFFGRIQAVVEERKTSSRVRFMLQDIQDLRANKWVSRRTDAGPKTIEEIHKEAKLEALRIQLADQRPPAPPNRRSEERTRRKTDFRPQPVTNEDGWSNVPSKAAKMSVDNIDPDKIRTIKKLDTENIKLGPTRGMATWGTGSAATKTTETLKANNRFQMLEDDENSPAISVYAGRASEPVRSSYDRSISRGRVNKGKTFSQRASREASVELKSSHVLRGDEKLDEDKLKTNIGTLIEEYINNCDFTETLASLCQLVHPSRVETVVEECFNIGLEKKSIKDREACGDLLRGLMQRKILSPVNVSNGLGRILEFVDDFIIDIPKFWDHTSDILTRILTEEDCFGEIIPNCCSYFHDENMSKNFIEPILHSVHRQDRETFLQITSRHKQLVEDILAQKLESYLEEKKLADVGPEPLVNGSLQDDLARKLDEVFTKQVTGNDELSRIDGILCDKPMESKTVRTLVTAVIESVVNGIGGPSVSCVLNKDLLNTRVPILKKYLDANKDRELYALYAIQSLVNKLEHPNKLLHHILEVLYDKDCISEDALFDWEKSEDAEEQEGKGVALKSCTQFFDWLRTAEEDDDGQVV